MSAFYLLVNWHRKSLVDPDIVGLDPRLYVVEALKLELV